VTLVDERTALVEAIRPALASLDLPIVCAYLFGSRARRDADAQSDIDVAVLIDPALPPQDRFHLGLALASDLERRLGVSVDLVVLNDAPPSLAHRVVRDGVVILSRDERQRIRFEADVLRAYLDFREVLDRYDAYLLARAREGRLGSRS
jgi:predicted nucleotidyltransferase